MTKPSGVGCAMASSIVLAVIFTGLYDVATLAFAEGRLPQLRSPGRARGLPAAVPDSAGRWRTKLPTQPRMPRATNDREAEDRF